jgi:hypothetical protein
MRSSQRLRSAAKNFSVDAYTQERIMHPALIGLNLISVGFHFYRHNFFVRIITFAQTKKIRPATTIYNPPLLQ